MTGRVRQRGIDIEKKYTRLARQSFQEWGIHTDVAIGGENIDMAMEAVVGQWRACFIVEIKSAQNLNIGNRINVFSEQVLRQVEKVKNGQSDIPLKGYLLPVVWLPMGRAAPRMEKGVLFFSGSNMGRFKSELENLAENAKN